MAPEIVFHHLNASRSTRIFWVLEELGLDYKVQVHLRTAAGRAPDALKKIISLGSAPVVEVDGEVLHESGYIITRLLALSSSSEVETTPSNGSQYWSAFAEGTLMVWMQAGTIIRGTTKGFAGAALAGNEKGQEAVQAYGKWTQDAMITPTSQAHMDYMEEYLAKHKYFSGSDKLGLADFMLLFPLYMMLPQAIEQGDGPTDTGRGNLKIGPNLRDWWKRIEARPALKKALKRQQDEEDASRSRL